LKDSNIFSKFILRYLIATKNGQNRNDLKLPVDNKIFYFCCRKLFSEFSNICPNAGRCMYIYEGKLYRHCKFSANFRFRKMFYPDKISLSNPRELNWSSLNLIAKTRLFLFWLFEYSFDRYISIPCYSTLRHKGPFIIYTLGGGWW
jgi:hypothetical protein